MKCANCGADIAEGAKFCEYCGSPVAVAEQTSNNSIPTYEEYVHPSNNPQNVPVAPSMKKQIWALILGIAGLSSAWTGFFSFVGLIGIVISLVGLIIGIKAKQEIPANKMGRCGFILSLIGLILSVLLTLFTTIVIMG